MTLYSFAPTKCRKAIQCIGEREAMGDELHGLRRACHLDHRSHPDTARELGHVVVRPCAIEDQCLVGAHTARKVEAPFIVWTTEDRRQQRRDGSEPGLNPMLFGRISIQSRAAAVSTATWDRCPRLR
jgi:hypothetical protein